MRRDLWAKVTRALFFDLVELGEEREVEGRAMFGVVSMGDIFSDGGRRTGEGFCVNEHGSAQLQQRNERFFDACAGAA